MAGICTHIDISTSPVCYRIIGERKEPEQLTIFEIGGAGMMFASSPLSGLASEPDDERHFSRVTGLLIAAPTPTGTHFKSLPRHIEQTGFLFRLLI